MSNQSLENKPTAAFVITLITGIIDVIAAIVLLILAAIVTNTYRNYYYFYNFQLGTYILAGIGFWVLIAAVILIVAALKLNSDPLEHAKWGVVILIFSIGVASILGIIGGILALTFTPKRKTPTRICINCGRYIEEDTQFCPYCGKKTA